MNKHRSSALDAYIGQNVKVSFKDGTEAKGILGFSKSFSREEGFAKINHYFLRRSEGTLSFRKTHVKNIERVIQ